MTPVAATRRQGLRLAAGVLAVAAAMGAGLAHAQNTAANWPSKPIRLIVPYTPGGSADVMGRAIGQYLSVAWGQPVLIDNKPGADGLIGAEFVARAPADGYTLLFGPNALYSIFPYMHPHAATDARKDLLPVAGVTIAPMVMAVSTTIEPKTVPEFIAYAKAHPGQVSFGSAGNSSLNRMIGENFARLAGVKLIHVPYKGSSQASADLAGGQIQAFYGSLTSIDALVKSGKARVLAVSSVKRFPDLPDVPALSEDLKGWREMSTFQGIFGPVGLPAAISAKISAEVGKAAQTADFQAKLKANAFASGYATPAQLKAQLKEDYDNMGVIIRAAKIAPEE